MEELKRRVFVIEGIVIAMSLGLSFILFLELHSWWSRNKAVEDLTREIHINRSALETFSEYLHERCKETGR